MLDAIRVHGVDNISMLAERADLRIETARYQIWHELPSRGIGIDVELDFGLMGLETWEARINLPENVKKARTILEYLKGECGAIYGTEVLPAGRILAIVPIPVYGEHRLKRILDWLVSMNQVEAYELRKMNWFQSVSLNLDCYDLSEGTWNIDWDLIQRRMMTTLASKKNLPLPGSQSACTYSTIDSKDLSLIHGLQVRLPSAISKLAESAGLDQFNARYHYNKHVKRYVKGYCIRAKQTRRQSLSVPFLFSYSSSATRTKDGEEEVSDFPRIRACALSLPFTTAEWKTEANNTYAWLVACPPEYIADTFRYVSKNTRPSSPQRGELRYDMLDATSEFKQPLPAQMFDQAKNRWRFEPKISLGLFHAGFDEVSSRCEYKRAGHCTYDGARRVLPHPCKLSMCAFARR